MSECQPKRELSVIEKEIDTAFKQYKKIAESSDISNEEKLEAVWKVLDTLLIERKGQLVDD